MASNALSMIGMANKAGRVSVGEEPCESAVRGKHARLLLVASDAADNTRRRCDYFAEVGNCLLVTLPDTKAELGFSLGRSSCAIIAVTDIGFAASIVKRLAASDPATYGETAEKMALKAKRALERRTQMAQKPPSKQPKQGKPQAKVVEAPKSPSRPQRAGKANPSSRPKLRDGKPGYVKAKGNANPYAGSRPVKKGKGSDNK